MLELEGLWKNPPPVLEIKGNEVHVWQADLNLPEWKVKELECTLSFKEKLRAERMVFDRHRRRFIAGRGILRIILGQYLNMEPAKLEFSYGQRGKPELANNSPEGKLRFNLSHSEEMVLCAVARKRSVGIDVEYVLRKTDVEQLAKRFFFPDEFSVINSLPPAEKQEEFFKGWTVKEAYLKATGEGLHGLEQVEVSLSPGGPTSLLSIRGIPVMATRWSSRQIKPSTGYVAAVIVEGKDWYLSQFCVNDDQLKVSY
jgi:4'-phosphopantetheinyl transferase